MGKIYLILTLSVLMGGCSTKTLPTSFSVLTDTGHTQNVSLEALDLRARNYIANEWGISIDEINSWELVNAQHREDYDAISLTYQYKIAAPLVIVMFDKQGFPNKIMGYK